MSRIYLEFFYLHSIPEMLLWGVLLVGAWTAAAIFFRKKKWDKAWKTLNRVVLAVVVLFILYWTLGKRNPSENGVSLIPFYSLYAARTQSEMYREVVANVLLFIPVGLCAPFSLCRPHRVSTTHPRQVSTGDGSQVTSGADGWVSTGQGAQVSRSQPLNDSTGQLPPVSRSQPLNDSSTQITQETESSRALETGSSRVLETSERESVETGRRWTNHPVRISILFAVLLSVGIELAQWKWGLGLAETDDVIMNTLGASFGTLAFFFSHASRFHLSFRSPRTHLHKGE